MSLQAENVLFLDCQTTGSTPQSGTLLEIAWSRSNSADGLICSTLIAQEQKIPRRITNLTGITDDHLIDAKTKRDAAEELAQFICENSLRYCVIHFAQFEKAFLQDLFAALDREFPLPIICTHQVAKRLFPNLPSRGVRALAGYFGQPLDDLKRASCHVEATDFIWRNLSEELQQKNIADMAELIDWMKQPIITKRTGYEYPIDRIKRLSMPDDPGIYRMLNKKGAVLYVGKATSLKSRVNSYFRGNKSKGSRKQEMLAQVWDIDITVCGSALEAALMETDEIKRLNPPYNVSLKRGDRSLIFYSPSFESSSFVQDDGHPIGPFTSFMAIQPFLLLTEFVNSGIFNPLIFFDPVDEFLIAPGFALFSARHSKISEGNCTPRQLLALGVKLYRAAIKAGLLEEAADDQSEMEQTDEERELTPEDIADKFERVLMRSARGYLRARQLTRLLNSRIQVCKDKSKKAIDSSGWRVLQFSGGKLRTGDKYPQSEARPGKNPWSQLEIDDYDRMSVLMQEILRSNAQLLSLT